MSAWKKLTVLLTASIVLLTQSSAIASPFDLYGLSSRSIGVGGAVTAAARDYSALFYNPGRLGFVPPSVGAHFTATFDHVEIRLLDRPGGFDVPDPPFGASILTMPTAGLPNPRSDTTNDPNAFMLSGGFVHGFGLWWFKMGAAFSLPLSSMAATDIRYVDEREQYFSNRLYFQLLNRRVNRPAFLLGVGFRPLKWLGFGASVNIFGNFLATTHMFIPDAGNLQEVNLNMEVKLKYDAAVIAGIEFEPADWVGIGISFRDRSWFGADFTNHLQLGLKSQAEQNFSYGFSFSPRVLSAGLRFDIGRDWTLSADSAWVLWSEFRPETGIDDEAGFDDSYTVKLGVEWRATKFMDVRAGLGWVPSPVPDQDGRTNFVDNDRIDSSVGFSFYVPQVKGLSIDLHAQFLALLPRQQDKSLNAANPIIDEFPESYDIKTEELLTESEGLQTNNPGWPGYKSKGFVGSVGVGVTYKFPPWGGEK